MHKDNYMEESKDLVASKEHSLIEVQKQQIEQMNSIAQDVVNSVAEDRDRADELYDFMRDQIDIDGDKNPATREAMAKALDLKMKGTDQKIELLKIKAKLINPQKDGFNVNINLGNYDEKKGSNTNSMIDIAEKFREQYGN
jgi:hypothetical protein